MRNVVAGGGDAAQARAGVADRECAVRLPAGAAGRREPAVEAAAGRRSYGRVVVEPLEPVVPDVPVPAPLDVPMPELFVLFEEPDPLVSELFDPVVEEDEPLFGMLLDELPGVLLEVVLLVSVELDGLDDDDIEDDEDGVDEVEDEDGIDEVEEEDGVDGVVVVVVVVVDAPERPYVRSSWRLQAVVSTAEPSSAARMTGT